MKTWNKIFYIVYGLLAIALGIACLCLPETAYMTLCYVVGAILVLLGLAELFGYFKYSIGFFGSGWVLAYSIITILFGVFVLCNQSFVQAVLPIIFAIWILTMGFMRFVGSFDLMKIHVSTWWVELINGILDIIIAIIFMFEPIGGALTITIAMGVILILNGCSILSDVYYFSKFSRFAHSFIPYNEQDNKNK